jgi:rhodanese-related sulfurtransferase
MFPCEQAREEIIRIQHVMKFSIKALLVWAITVYLLIWVAVPSLIAEERTSAPPAKPLTTDPKEISDKIELITAEELKKLIDEGADIIVVDTNDERVYHIKHIKGAINFPWAPVIREPINLSRSKLLIIYCGCAGEKASINVAGQLMSDWGFKKVKVLDGGFSRWLKLGYPTEP